MRTRHELLLAGCLRRLFKTRFILRRNSETWFKNIEELQKEINAAVKPFSAQVVVDSSLGVAFLQTQDPETEEKIDYQLGTRLTLKKLSSLIFLYVRRVRIEFHRSPGDNEVPLITKSEIKETVRPFLEKFEKYKEDKVVERELKEALRELMEHQILVETAERSGTYEVTAVCDVLLPKDQIEETQIKAEAYMSTASVLEENTEDEGGLHA